MWVSLTVSGLDDVPQAGLFSKLLDIRWLIRLILGLIRLDNDPPFLSLSLSHPPKLLSRSVVRMPLLATCWPPLSLTAAGLKTPIQ